MTPLTSNQQIVVECVCTYGFTHERSIELVLQAENGAKNLTVDELLEAVIKLSFDDNTDATYQHHADIPELGHASQAPEEPDNTRDKTAGECHRPGISDDYLRRHNIRHVGKAESIKLIGYQAPGIAIPYTTIEGEPLIVNGRPFIRIRLDDPTPSAKYLSPKGSGAHLFIPLGQAVGKKIVLCESEFKSTSLAEAGIPAVGIGGICSAMHDGRLIPELAHFIAKYSIEAVYFLGDTDTWGISAFSIEAIKLAKALPEGCGLYLPRIPVPMPNGIDECRAKFGEDFPTFWQEIEEKALMIDPELPPAALMVRLAIRELPAIAELPDREIAIKQLSTLASYLPAIDLGNLSQAVNATLKINKTAFCKNAKQIGDQRRKEAAEAAQRDPQKLDLRPLANDTRPKIEIPGSRDRLSSEFANDLGPILAKKKELFVKDKVVVILDPKKANLTAMLPAKFITKLEEYIIPFKVILDPSGMPVAINRSLKRDESDTVLVSEHLTRHLTEIRGVNDVRLPVRRASGQLELLPEGYDLETKIYTKPEGPKIEELPLEIALEFLRFLFKEFCFSKDDEKRATAVAIAAMLTLFCFNLLPRGSRRPGFFYSANAEGSGKGLLAKIAIITRLGRAAMGPLPERNDELEKLILAGAIEAFWVLCFDNVKRHVESGALESALTSQYIKGRILGLSKMAEVENLMTVFITGNGATISSDMRRRCLQIELQLQEAKAEDRVIENPLDDAKILAMRSEILSALWTITLAWEKAGRPLAKTLMSDCEPWSEIIGGILEHHDFGSPCEPNSAEVSGDLDTSQMIQLVNKMELKKEYPFGELVALAQSLDIFVNLVGDGSDGVFLERTEKSTFSLILRRFLNRKFASGRVFHRRSKTTHDAVYYVDKI